MVKRLLGRKLGMTQVYLEKGECLPVTVIEAGPCKVIQVKTGDRDGYSALQLAFGSRRARRRSRAELGHLVPKAPDAKPEQRKKALTRQIKDMKESPEVLREVPWDGKEEVKVGDEINVSIFEGWKKIDVIGTSKGRGFAGAVARWGFHGSPAPHQERAPGSIIGGQEGGKAGHVVKGKKMAGHWGVERNTSRNLEVVQIDQKRNLLLVKGAVPGPTGGILMLKESHWVPPKKSIVVSKRQKRKK